MVSLPTRALNLSRLLKYSNVSTAMARVSPDISENFDWCFPNITTRAGGRSSFVPNPGSFPGEDSANHARGILIISDAETVTGAS